MIFNNSSMQNSVLWRAMNRMEETKTGAIWKPPSQSAIILATMFVAACGIGTPAGNVGFAILNNGGGGSPAAKPAAKPAPDPTPDPTPPRPPIDLDIALVLPENSDGSGEVGSATAPILVFTITETKDNAGEVTYRLAESETDFAIDGYKLFYIGADSGKYDPDNPKIFAIKITRVEVVEVADGEPAEQPIIDSFDYSVTLIAAPDLPLAPTGLFLRTAGTDGTADVNFKIYDGGDATIEYRDTDGEITKEIRNFNTLAQHVNVQNADGNAPPPPQFIGIFAHDTLNDGESEVAGTSISVSYAYQLAADAGAGYGNADFEINNNQLYFSGGDSGIYTLLIDTIATVTINLPSTFEGLIDVDASGDTADEDTREFAFSGGAIARTANRVIQINGEDVIHRTIDVAAGVVYAHDIKGGSGKIISFSATTNGLVVPTDTDTYEYYVIVTDSGEVDVKPKTELEGMVKSGTEFYTIGTVGARVVPSINIDGFRLTDKTGNGLAEIRYFNKVSGDIEIEVSGNIISITARDATTYADLLNALQNNEQVTALLDVTITDFFIASTTTASAGFGSTKLLGSDSNIKAKVNIGGLIIEEAKNADNAGENNLDIIAKPTVQAGNNVIIEADTISLTDPTITVTYDKDATLAHLVAAINSEAGPNALVNFFDAANPNTEYTATDATHASLAGLTVLLSEVLFARHSTAAGGAVSGDEPETSPGTEQSGALLWQSEAIIDTDDYTIKLSAEESLPSAAESIDGDDDFALPPWSHGMDDGETAPNKIHLNEAYYAGSYDAYLDYLQFILDGGDPSVGGLLIGPSTDETLAPDADEPTPSPEEKEEKPKQPKNLQAMLDAIGAAEQSAPAPDPHQWQPDSYSGDSDLDPITPTDPDIL